MSIVIDGYAISTKASTYLHLPPEIVGNASIRFFGKLYSPGKQIQKQKYNDMMVVSDRLIIDPVLLPPSPRATYFMVSEYTTK